MRRSAREAALVLTVFTAPLPLGFTMGASMAAHAILDPAYPFFPMFGNDVRLLMCMAAKARVLLVVPLDVACSAGRVVMSI